jgi:glucose-1-phosphate thymidylyltransferase
LVGVAVKALVLAGGSGTRLRPLTYAMSKQLIPIANRPILHDVLRNVRAAGIDDVGVIVGDRAAEIEESVGDGAQFSLRITYLPQERPLGLAHAVSVGRPFLGDDDFLMCLGDTVMPDGFGLSADEFRALRPAAHLVVAKVDNPSAFGVAEVDPHGRIRSLVEKPAVPSTDTAVVGVYFFTRAIHEATQAIVASPRGELEITDAVQWLIELGEPVLASTYHGFWQDAGTAEGVLAGNRELLGRLQPRVAGFVDAESEIRGTVVVEAGARVIRSRVEGPAIIGRSCVIEDSWIGSATALGAGCLVRRTSIADSILLDGATVDDVRRVHGCLIGRRAAVMGGGTDVHCRLILADDSTVDVRSGSPDHAKREGASDRHARVG